MMTVMVPYTYYVQVPTYGVVPTAGYGAAPVSYGAPAPTYGAAPLTYGAPMAYGAAPATVPVSYGAPGTVPTYGAPPSAEDCKKQITELSGKVDKLQSDLTELRTNVVAARALNDQIVGETVTALQRHQDQITALQKVTADAELLKESKTVADREKKLKVLAEEAKKAREGGKKTP